MEQKKEKGNRKTEAAAMLSAISSNHFNFHISRNVKKDREQCP